MNIEKQFPSIAYMEAAAARRMPKFVHDYLEGGIGTERCVTRNKAALNDVLLMPRYIADAQQPSLHATVLGQQFDAPFGVAPLGLAGLLWPDAERQLAAAARQHNLPFILSTYACASLERIKPVAGPNGWFQYYPSDNPAIEQDLLDRCKAAGYKTLVLTVDIPIETRRDRDIRNGVSVPPRFDLRTLWQIVTHPTWALNMLRAGVPQFETLAPYYSDGSGSAIKASVDFIHESMKGHITAERFASIRAAWGGNLLVKGVLAADEAAAYVELGADGVIVSNHGGRQFDAAPTPVDVLPAMRTALGADALIFADGGVRNGLDIARMLALGADFVLLGRPFIYSLGAIGRKGPAHAMHILKAELHMTLAQMGCTSVDQLPNFLHG